MLDKMLDLAVAKPIRYGLTSVALLGAFVTACTYGVLVLVDSFDEGVEW